MTGTGLLGTHTGYVRVFELLPMGGLLAGFRRGIECVGIGLCTHITHGIGLTVLIASHCIA